MSEFGKTLFSGSRFIFWSLAPFLLLFAILLPLSITEWTFKSIGVIIALELSMLLLLPALYNPRRFHWATRIITALVFGACLFAAVEETWLGLRPQIKADGQGEHSVWNAIGVMITFGLPCLWYTVFGRWRLSDNKNSDAADKIDIINLDV